MDFFLNKWRSVAELPISTNEIDESGDVQPTSTNEGNGSGDVQPTLNLNLEDEVTIIK